MSLNYDEMSLSYDDLPMKYDVISYDQAQNDDVRALASDVTTLKTDVKGINANGNTSYTCLCYDFIIEAVFMGLLCLFGFAGNTLSMVCLSRDRSKTATPLLLISLEVADTLFLITVFILRVLDSVNTFAYPIAWLQYSAPYLAKYLYPCALMAETGTIYLTLLVTLNRYVSVCWPYRAKELCMVGHARLHVAVVVAFSILFNLPRFLEYDVIVESTPEPSVNGSMVRLEGEGVSLSPIHGVNGTLGYKLNREKTALYNNPTYRIVYSNILYFVRLITTLRETKKRRATMLRKASNPDQAASAEDDITFMLVVVVMVFVVTQTPALITQVLASSLTLELQDCPTFFFFYERISDLLVVANSSLNFIIYCFCSRRFRQILLEMVCRRYFALPMGNEMLTVPEDRTLTPRPPPRLGHTHDQPEDTAKLVVTCNL